MLQAEISNAEFADLVRHRRNAQRRVGESDDYAAAKKWVETELERHPNFTVDDMHEYITNHCRRAFA